MKWQTDSVMDFRCPKCRNQDAIVHKVTLTAGILPELLRRGGAKYRLVTCSLCGYTEIYDLSVYAKNPTPQPAKDESTGLAPGT